jgi:hypothetical protein
LKGDIFCFGRRKFQTRYYSSFTNKVTGTIDDLYKESEPQPQLRDLLENCLSKDRSVRPSSLTILEIAREHLCEYDAKLGSSLHELLGSGPGGYLLQYFILIASELDEIAPFSTTTRIRRQMTIQRLILLCKDGAGELLDEHLSSIHLSVLLDRQDAIRHILDTKKTIDVNKKWKNSGWTPLHLAVQEGKETMVTLLMGCGANPDIVDEARRPPEYYKT